MRALLVSGDPAHAHALVAALAAVTDAVDAEVAPTPDAALERVADGRVDVLLVDLAGREPPDAVAFIRVARSRAPSVPIVALVISPEASVEALAAGADGFGPRHPGAASTIATVLRQTCERFQPTPDTPLRVLYVTRHTPMRDEAVSTLMTVDVIVPTAEGTIPPPYDEGPLACDAAVLDASAGGTDLVGVAQDLVTRLGDAPLFVLADATDRQLARAVLRLGARQVVARTGAWPVRLFAAIQQAARHRRDSSEESPVTPDEPVPMRPAAPTHPIPADVVPLEQHRALAAQLETARSELDALRASAEERLQKEVSTLKASLSEAVREIEAGRAADVRAAALEIQHLQALIRQQTHELGAAREAADQAERQLEAAREATGKAEIEADEARRARPVPEPTPVAESAPVGDGGFTPVAADFVREIARHAADAARLQRASVEPSTGIPDLASVHKALAAAERAHEVAQQFLAFDESRQAPPTPMGLDDLLASLLPVLTAMVGGSVRLSIAAPVAGRVLVKVPRTGVARLIAALVASAVDALPLGGHIDVEAGVEPKEAGSPDATARIAVAVGGFGMRSLRAPEALVSPLPPWSLDLRLKETEQGTAYELVLPATVATSGSGNPEP